MLLQEAVQLSEGQEDMILQFRRATLTKLGAIIKQRAQLLQLQAEVLATLRAEGVSAKDVGIAHVKVAPLPAQENCCWYTGKHMPLDMTMPATPPAAVALLTEWLRIMLEAEDVPLVAEGYSASRI